MVVLAWNVITDEVSMALWVIDQHVDEISLNQNVNSERHNDDDGLNTEINIHIIQGSFLFFLFNLWYKKIDSLAKCALIVFSLGGQRCNYKK